MKRPTDPPAKTVASPRHVHSLRKISMKLKDDMRSSVPIKYVSRICHPGDPRSGQFRDPSIINLWGNVEMLPVLHKLTETAQFFQDHNHSPHLWWSECNWWSGSREGHLRIHDVTIRFSPITRDKMEVETRKWCETTWLATTLRKLCILTYLGPCSDLDLTWPEVKFWNWLLKIKSKFFEPAQRGKHDGIILTFISLISKKLSIKTLMREKNDKYFFTSWPLEPKPLTFGQINVSVAWRELSNALF